MNAASLIFPPALYCLSCGKQLSADAAAVPAGAARAFAGEAAPLCASCLDEIPWVRGRLCEKCGKMLSEENPGTFCGDCDGGAHVYGRGYACALYAGRAADLVRDMKYRDRAYTAEALAAVMAARYFAETDPATGEALYYDAITAIPMSRNKKARRGFDQAALLARGLAKRIGIRYAEGLLERKTDTAVMSSLGLSARMQNLRGTIAAGYGMIEKIKGKRILLADDVYTTGSSADACADILYGAGAARADVFVFAIGADGGTAKGLFKTECAARTARL
ncbi:MAG: double zinc ribbon domain-containing protein [Clostridiales Family XIII bacterium]|jgi:ComF family protein|nr:double zinc ribbon domain-containing protein [Clostridiales Family XIII bacterium]